MPKSRPKRSNSTLQPLTGGPWFPATPSCEHGSKQLRSTHAQRNITSGLDLWRLASRSAEIEFSWILDSRYRISLYASSGHPEPGSHRPSRTFVKLSRPRCHMTTRIHSAVVPSIYRRLDLPSSSYRLF